jgi:shikimate dehydrogenase
MSTPDIDTPKPIRVGLIGAGIQMSKSPALHEREARAQGLAYSYELIDLAQRGVGVESLPELLSDVEARGFVGVNVTHPCKQAILPYLTELSEDARALGAVNTIVLKAGRRVGHNTDWSGFYESFSRGLADAPRGHAGLLGAGGAGVAVAHAALKLGIHQLSIFDTDPIRASALASSLNGRFPGNHAQSIGELRGATEAADGLIHATPTGMRSHPGLPIAPELIQSRHWVADIVYMPLNTALLDLARKRGCRTLDGGGMAVFQAVGALRLFAAVEPVADRMLEHSARLVADEPPSAASPNQPLSRH